MNPAIKQAFEFEMDTARRLVKAGDLETAFSHLERAHVIGQQYVVPHVRSHWWMLRIGLKRHSMTEIWGQAIRIALGAFGSAVGIVPTGNTGGTDINIFRKLSIQPDIEKILRPDSSPDQFIR